MANRTAATKLNKSDESDKLENQKTTTLRAAQIDGRLSQSLAIAVGLGIFTTLILPEFALGAGDAAVVSKFDLDAGMVAATTPLVNGLKAHWGKAVLLSGGASALIGEGDSRQRAIRAAVGCAASGGVVLALIAMLA